MKTPSSSLLAVALALVAFLAALGSAALAAEAPRATASLEAPGEPTDEPGDVRLFNEYIAIIVNATGENTGRFAIETTGGDPDRTTDDQSVLIYKVPGQSPWTSYATVRIDGIDYVFGGRPSERAGRAGLFGEPVVLPRVVDDNRIETVYQIGPVRATQTLTIIRSSTTGLLDTARIEYVLENTSERSVNVGLRLMLDTMLGQNDGAPFRVGELAIVSDTRFDGEAIPDFWQAFDSLSDPKVTAQGTLRGSDLTTPDSVAFSNWGAMADGLWDFDFEPGRDFTRLGEFELDSATAMYWNPRPLAPGESRRYAVDYGLGGISISPGQLSIGVTSPATVSGDSERTVTFPVVAYIQNTGQGEARQAVARLQLPPGLAPAAGEQLERALGNLPPGRTAQVTWRIAVNPGVAGEFRYSVRVEAINAEANQVSRLVNIVSPAQLQIDLPERNGRLLVEENRWTPLPYRVRARVVNVGGADATNVVVRFESHLLELAEGDVAAKPLGRIPAGGSAEVTWHVQPQTVSPTQAIPYIGNLAYTVKGVIAGASEEYRADGFVDVPPLASELRLDQVGEGAVHTGDYFRVRVEAQNLRRFYGAELVIEYDPAALRLVHVDPGRIFVAPAGPKGELVRLAWKTPVVDTPGPLAPATVRLAGERAGADRPTLYWVSDTVATLHFQALAPGRHAVTFKSARVYDQDGQSVQFEQASETIVVSE